MEKASLPVDVRGSKTSLPKLPSGSLRSRTEWPRRGSGVKTRATAELQITANSPNVFGFVRLKRSPG